MPLNKSQYIPIDSINGVTPSSYGKSARTSLHTIEVELKSINPYHIELVWRKVGPDLSHLDISSHVRQNVINYTNP